ncbi:hypothetical protein AMTR_s00101p00073470 [Amborella trichopoda]|uniref:Uncharacterized protein n=1 Tax=Amborella trichopoda TaxID=13333 RepID=W1NQ61_AMBTC|nr:hypothetical protein AMTR_s00101p00073470 [Amborella trichopoda]
MKKRNRLEQKRLNDLVFVQYNQRLKDRHQERFQIEDPIIVEDLDQTSEWLVKPNAKDEHVFEGESLTCPSARGGWFRIDPGESYKIPNTKEGEGSGPGKGTGEGEEEGSDEEKNDDLEGRGGCRLRGDKGRRFLCGGG